MESEFDKEGQEFVCVGQKRRESPAYIYTDADITELKYSMKNSS